MQLTSENVFLFNSATRAFKVEILKGPQNSQRKKRIEMTSANLSIFISASYTLKVEILKRLLAARFTM